MARLGKLLGIAGVSLFLFILLLPTLLGTSFGKDILVSWVNRDLTGKFSVENVSLGWFSGQKLSGVSYQDGSIAVHLEHVDVQSPLSKVIFDPKNIQGIVLNGVEAESSGLSLKKGEISAQIENSILSLQGEADLAEERFSVEGKVPLTISQMMNAHLSIKNLPATIIDSVLSNRLGTELFGSKVNVALSQGDLVVESGNFRGTSRFTIQNGMLAGDGNASCKLFDENIQIKFSGNLGNDQGNFLVSLMSEHIQLEFLKIDLKKSEASFESSLRVEPIWTEFFNETFQLTAKGKARIEGGSVALHETIVKGDSQNQHFEAFFNYKRNELELISPAMITVKVDPSTLSSFDFAKNGAFNLKKPVTATIFVTPFHLKGFKPTDLNGQIKIDTVDFFSYGNEFVFKDVEVPFELLAEEKRLKLSPTLKTYLPKISKEGAIAGKISVKGVDDLKTSTFKAKLQLMDVPTEILSSYSPSIPKFLGPIVSLDLDAQYEKKLSIDGTLQGKNIQGLVSLGSDDAFTAELQFTLNQERLNAIAGLVREDSLEPHYTLLETSPASLHITAVSIAPDKFATEALALDFQVSKFFLNDLKRKQTIRLTDVTASLNTENLSDRVLFKVQALPENGERSKGSLSVNGEIAGIVTREGKWNFKNATFEAKASALAFNSAAFCDLFCPYPDASGKIEAFFGNLIDAEIRFKVQHMSGPIYASVRGGNGRMLLNGQLDQGFLYLREPLQAEVKASEALGKNVFKDIAPLLQGLESSNSPIKFTVPSEGFVFPIKNFNSSGIAFRNAVLETGKMVFKNSPEIAALMTLLNGEQRERQTIWLTPIFFSMKEGKLRLKRADMLVSDSYHFASWGVVDLASEKVDMTIGVSGMTLAQALKIDSMKRDYMLQVPFKGPLSNPKIDKTKATAKIASLVAANRGPEGALIGAFIDIASGGIMESDPPPPTTRPFPWGEIAERAPEEEPQPRHETLPVDEPVDMIEKGSKKLLKKLFH